MESFKGYRKTTLRRIAQSRNINTEGTLEEVRARLLQYDAPFSIDKTKTQEEQVLSLIFIPLKRLQDYVSENLLDENNLSSELSRKSLIELILNEKLSYVSEKIIDLADTPLPALQRRAGKTFSGKADLIREILNLKEQDRKYIDRIKSSLDDIGFEIIDSPPKREMKTLDLDVKIFDMKEAKDFLNKGMDPRYIPEYILDEVVQSTLLYERNVNPLSFARRLVTDPLSPLWESVYSIIKNVKMADLKVLARSYGYTMNLEPIEIEFLFQRQYLRKYKPVIMILPNEIKELLKKQFNVKSFQDIEFDLSDDAKSRLKLFAEWLQFDDAQLQHVASGYDIDLPYPDAKEFFWNDLYIYIDTIDELKPGEYNFETASDTELLKWCPTLPYGREEMINAFNNYWNKPRIIYVNNTFYQTESWEEMNEIDDIDFFSLRRDEIVNLIPYLMKTAYHNEIIDAYLAKIPGKQEEASENIQKLFKLMANVGAASFGAVSEEIWSNKSRPANEELKEKLLKELDVLLDSLSSDETERLKKMHRVNLKKMSKYKQNVYEMLQDDPSWAWVETAYYHYYIITRKPPSYNAPFIFRGYEELTK